MPATCASVWSFSASTGAPGERLRGLMGALAALRSSGRFPEREGNGKVAALSAIRAPKVGKSLPKPIQMAAAKRLTDADERAGDDRDPLILARDGGVVG